jgi:hypothetical protein
MTTFGITVTSLSLIFLRQCIGRKGNVPNLSKVTEIVHKENNKKRLYLQFSQMFQRMRSIYSMLGELTE